MRASSIIDAKEQGIAFDRILHAVHEDREEVSTLSEEELEFFSSMIEELKKAAPLMEQAFKNDDKAMMKRESESLQEILQMIEDSCGNS